MSTRTPLVFKFANEDIEFEQIHRLNYKTFVEELPQHHPSPAQRLVDKFHAENSYLPSGRRICEIRLLAVEKKFRGAQVLQGILALLWQHGIERGYDLAIISGTTRQIRLYQHQIG